LCILCILVSLGTFIKKWHLTVCICTCLRFLRGSSWPLSTAARFPLCSWGRRGPDLGRGAGSENLLAGDFKASLRSLADVVYCFWYCAVVAGLLDLVSSTLLKAASFACVLPIGGRLGTMQATGTVGCILNDSGVELKLDRSLVPDADLLGAAWASSWVSSSWSLSLLLSA